MSKVSNVPEVHMAKPVFDAAQDKLYVFELRKFFGFLCIVASDEATALAAVKLHLTAPGKQWYADINPVPVEVLEVGQVYEAFDA